MTQGIPMASIIFRANRLGRLSIFTCNEECPSEEVPQFIVPQPRSKHRVAETLAKSCSICSDPSFKLELWVRRIVEVVYDCIIADINLSLSTSYNPETFSTQIHQETLALWAVDPTLARWSTDILSEAQLELLKRYCNVAPVLCELVTRCEGKKSQFTLREFARLERLKINNTQVAEDWDEWTGYFREGEVPEEGDWVSVCALARRRLGGKGAGKVMMTGFIFCEGLEALPSIIKALWCWSD